MRLMSFSMTVEQLLGGTKDVTRRTGWRWLRPGQPLCAVRKAMGLKRGESVERLAEIEVVSVRRERLDSITADDVRREGFPDLSPTEFVEMFCKAMRCSTDAEVTRIELRVVRRLAPREPKQLQFLGGAT